MHGLPFIDAHAHFWDLDRLSYPWLQPPFEDGGPNGSVEAIARTYLPRDYRADLADWNLVGSVHVDAGALAESAVAETEWLEAAAAQTGLPNGIVAFAALDAPDRDEVLARQAAHGRVRGIRQIVNWHPDPRRSYTLRDLTLDEQWRAGFRALALHRLSFDLQCYPNQMAGLVPLFADNPHVPVIVNHLGMPVLDDAGGLEAWRRGLQQLAAVPHVSIKLSGLGFIRRDWKAAFVLPFLEEAAALFGPNRCMIASDVPTDKLFAPVEQYRETYHRFLDAFSQDDRRAMLAGNANRIYRLGIDVR